jgi:hypothetical protein
MRSRLCLAVGLLAVGIAYVVDAIGWRTADRETDAGIAVVHTFAELLARPAYDLGDNGQVRVGVPTEVLGPDGPGDFLYLLFERRDVDDMVPRRVLEVVVRTRIGAGDPIDDVVAAMPQPGTGPERLGRQLVLQPVTALRTEAIAVGVFRTAPVEAAVRAPSPAGPALTTGAVQVESAEPWCEFNRLGATGIRDARRADARLRLSNRIGVPAFATRVLVPPDSRAALPRLYPPRRDPGLRLEATAAGFTLRSDTLIPFQFPEQHLLVRVRPAGPGASDPIGAAGPGDHVLRAEADWNLTGFVAGDRVAVEMIWCPRSFARRRIPQDVAADGPPRRTNVSVFTVR